MKKFCPNCGLTVGEQIGGRLGLGIAGAYFGSRVHPAVGILGALVGAYLGHRYIDSAIQNCPQCGAILMIVLQ